MARRTIPNPVSRTAKSGLTKTRKRSQQTSAPSIADQRSLRARQETARRVTSAASLAEFAVHQFVRAQKKSSPRRVRQSEKTLVVPATSKKPRRQSSKARATKS